jgi:hypothetical protein
VRGRGECRGQRLSRPSGDHEESFSILREAKICYEGIIRLTGQTRVQNNIDVRACLEDSKSNLVPKIRQDAKHQLQASHLETSADDVRSFTKRHKSPLKESADIFEDTVLRPDGLNIR